MKASKGLRFAETSDSLQDLRQSTQQRVEKRTNFLRQLDWDNYEKIRVVGKGAFGTAVLYRKKPDGLLVVLKKINMNELSASERQLAINEAKVLSIVCHPNIVSYYGSFEFNGDLYIEMEYADAGTLAEFLSHLSGPLSEFEILMIFQQIVCAISYLHRNNILHRDIKTANIFLNREGYIKLGDFGISKMLTTRSEAESVVGTPYYISPEICEGKSYDQKSDVWALGCVLYEMTCLHRTFEGSNLPVLVNKIVKGQFEPIKQHYSSQFRNLITQLLHKEPDSRPTAQEVEQKLMKLLSKLQLDRIQLWNRYKEAPTSIITSGILLQNTPTQPSLILSSMSSIAGIASAADSSVRYPHSIVYRVQMDAPHVRLSRLPLPPGVRIKEISQSSTHGLALSYEAYEALVFSWGTGAEGQLGLGESIAQTVSQPRCVDALRNRSIVHVCCGQGFSVFVSKNGLVMTCGDYRTACLGRAEAVHSFAPKLVDALLSADVSSVSCGTNHVSVVTGDGKAFSWGHNTYGKLGIGSNQAVAEVPTSVVFPEEVVIKSVYCGHDCTAFVDRSGSVWVCGNNEFNKLGLNEKTKFRTTKVSAKGVPTKLKWIRHRVHSVSLGKTHSAFVIEGGKAITSGNNREAQLGLGHVRPVDRPQIVRQLAEQSIISIQTGSSFTMASNSENVIYFWGARHLNPASSTTGECNQSLMNVIENTGADLPIVQIRDPQIIIDNLSDLWLLSSKRAVILKPQPVISLFWSPVSLHQGDVIGITNLFVFQDDSIYIVIDTTIAAIGDDSSLTNARPLSLSLVSEDEHWLRNSDLSDDANINFSSKIPEWIQKEIAENNSFIGVDVKRADSLPLLTANTTAKCECRHCHQCHRELNHLRDQLISKNNAIAVLQTQLDELSAQNTRLRQIEEQFARKKSLVWSNCCKIQ